MFAPAKGGLTVPVPTANTTLAFALIFVTCPSTGLVGILIVAVGLLAKITNRLLVFVELSE